MKFAYSNGEKIGMYEDGKAAEYEINYLVRYRETMKQTAKNKEWKEEGKASRMMDEEYYFMEKNSSEVISTLYGVSLTGKDNEIIAAFSVNSTSAIYKKTLDDEQKTEAHIISANDVDFTSVCVAADGQMLASVQTDPVSSQIAVFKKDSGDYKIITGGDSLDENPSFYGNGKTVYFNSYGIGRDANNNFIQYMPSEIYSLDLTTLEVKEEICDKNFSYIKPIRGEKGLYYIKKEGTEKVGGNPILEILLIPVRIIQGIAGFISWFVMCFSGKSLVSGQSARRGDAATKGANAKKAFINNNLINVDQQLKKNKKQPNYGFIPKSWKIILRNNSGTEEEIASGAADFCLVKEGEEEKVIYTNGKHIFCADHGKRTKLLDVDFCLKVGSLLEAGKKDEDLFGCL